MADKKQKVLIITPKFTGDFPCLFAPRKNQKGEEVGYDLTMIFKNVNIEGMKKLMLDTAKEKWGSNIPKNIQWPLKKPDAARLEEFPHYAGTVYASAKSKFAPVVIDAKKQPILEAKEIYSGCEMIARIGAYAWEYMGKNGVSFNLYAVQKVADGEKLFKQANHADLFEQLEDAGADAGLGDLGDLGSLSFEDDTGL